MEEKTSPFDTFIQVIGGQAEVNIGGKEIAPVTGQSIIIPAHSRNIFKAKNRFKMISTMIKNGYEDGS